MEAIALGAAQDIAIHVGPRRIASQDFASSPQASDHFLDCIVELGSHHRQDEGSKDCWRQFSKAPAHHEENSTSAREPLPAVHRGLEGSVDGNSKVLCRFDNHDWGIISVSQRSDRQLADGKVRALAWAKREVPRN